MDQGQQHNRFQLLLFALTTGLHLLVWQLANSEPAGDELRYLEQAGNILAGQPVFAETVISNTLLFPGILAGLQYIGLPIGLLNLFNIAVFVLSVLVLYATLRQVCTPIWAFLLALFYAIHPAFLDLASQVMTEALASLAAICIAWCLVNYQFNNLRLVYFVPLCSLAMAILALQKPLFGYTLAFTVLLATPLVFYRLGNVRKHALQLTTICALALILCTPNLKYNYDLTGNYFSWGTTGGEHLYWMSFGGEEIWGSWLPANEAGNFPELVERGYAQELLTATSKPGPNEDQYLMSLSLARIKDDPASYMINVVANAFRVLFNYPYSYRDQSLFTYGYILPNMAIFIAMLAGIFLLPVTWRHQPILLAGYMLMIVVYLGGNFLVSNTARQSLVIIGPLLIWLACQFRVLIDTGYINPAGRKQAI